MHADRATAGLRSTPFPATSGSSSSPSRAAPAARSSRRRSCPDGRPRLPPTNAVFQALPAYKYASDTRVQYVNAVGSAAVERAALVVDKRARILRTDAGRQLDGHRRGDAGRTEEHARARIEQPGAVAEELVAAAAASRIRRMRASGVKGLPFSVPSTVGRPSVSGSIASAGSSLHPPASRRQHQWCEDPRAGPRGMPPGWPSEMPARRAGKSRLSYSRSTVSSSGNPSKKVSGPRRVSTRFGMVIRSGT